MASVFGFRGEFSSDGRRLEGLFLFVPEAGVRSIVIEGAIKECLEDGHLSPDVISVITQQQYAPELQQVLSSDSLIERYSKLRRCKGVALCTFGSTGTAQPLWWVPSHGQIVSLSPANLISSAREAGLGFLSGRGGVVTNAPPGCYFRNPSGGKRSYFIRAGLMCRTSTEASFLAFSMLPMVAQATEIYGNKPNIIWVDTVSVAYVAYALINLGIEIGVFDARPELRSFSSYAGFRSVLPAPGQYPIFIISASTSGGLAKDIIAASNNNLDIRTTSTILGAYGANYPQLLYALPPARRGPALTSVDTLREICVTGEDFLFSPGEPKTVTLKRSQLPNRFSESFKNLQGNNLIHYFKRVSADRQPKPLLIDDKALIKDGSFQDWVKKRARGSFPATTRRIVYQNDDASKVIADLVLAEMSPTYTSNPPTIVSIAELELLPPEPDATVVIVAAVAGSGMELMRVTKALRNYQPSGSRFFLVGIIAARSYTQLRELQSNLTQSDRSVTYSLDVWCNFAPSYTSIFQYRAREITWLTEITSDGGTTGNSLSAFARERLGHLQREGIVRSDVPPSLPFLGLSDSATAFDVGKGFALWAPGFINCRCPCDVMFTVACWLQNAREDLKLPQQDRLEDGGFQQTVIAPDCFLRFTDSVIQSSILRSARDSELDYRAAPAISARAGEIISKFISMKEQSSGL